MKRSKLIVRLVVVLVPCLLVVANPPARQQVLELARVSRLGSPSSPPINAADVIYSPLGAVPQTVETSDETTALRASSRLITSLLFLGCP